MLRAPNLVDIRSIEKDHVPSEAERNQGGRSMRTNQKIFSLALMIPTLLLFVLTSGVYSQETAVKANATLAVIHSRKSVRQYTGQPVTKDELTTLVKAGMAAPTAVDKRPWAFVIVTDEEMLSKLAEGLPSSRMIVKARSAIVVCGVMSKALSGKGKEFWVQDTSAATENILLAAESMGLGAVWTGMYPMEDNVAFVQKVLGLPSDVIPLSLVAVGHPVGVEKPKNKFDPTNIHWEKW